MAKKYENLENITELLGAGKLKTASERLLSSEKELSEILKKLTALEEEKARAEAEAAEKEAEEKRIAEAEEQVRREAEEAKAAAEKEAEQAQAKINELYRFGLDIEDE